MRIVRGFVSRTFHESVNFGEPACVLDRIDRERKREREKRGKKGEEEKSPFTPSRHPAAISGCPDVLSIPNEYFCSRKFR